MKSEIGVFHTTEEYQIEGFVAFETVEALVSWIQQTR